MTRRVDLPPSFAGESFRVADGRAGGISRGRMLAGDLETPAYGVRSPVGADPLRALVPAFRPGDAYAGPTAARIWDAPVPLRVGFDRRLHVSSLMPTAPMRRPGVVGTSRAAGSPVEWGGVPVLGPEASWASLAGILSAWDLVAAADRLVTGTLRTPPVTSILALRAFLDGRSGARRIGVLRAALADVRVGSWSRPESLMRLMIVRAGMPEPVLNAPVTLSSGRVVRPDLAWPDLRIAIEYDGRGHDGPARIAHDTVRHEEMADDCWLIVRVRAGEFFATPSAVVARLVRRRAERGAVPLPGPVDFAQMPRLER